MVKKRWTWLGITLGILVIAAGAGVGLWYYLKPTDERLIRKRLSDFSAEVSKSGKEGMVSAVSRARKTARMFIEPCTFTYESRSWRAGPYSHDKLSGDILRYRAMMQNYMLALDDIQLELHPEKKAARVQMTVSIDGKFRDGSRCHEAFEVKGDLKKQDSQWFLGSFVIRKLVHQ